MRGPGRTPARPARWRAPADQLPAAGRTAAAHAGARAGPAWPGRLAGPADRAGRQRRRSPAAAPGIGRPPRADRHPAQVQGPGVPAGVPAIRGHRRQVARPGPGLRGAGPGLPARAALEAAGGDLRLGNRAPGVDPGTTRRRRAPALCGPDPRRARAVDRQRRLLQRQADRTGADAGHAGGAVRATGHRGRRWRTADPTGLAAAGGRSRTATGTPGDPHAQPGLVGLQLHPAGQRRQRWPSGGQRQHAGRRRWQRRAGQRRRCRCTAAGRSVRPALCRQPLRGGDAPGTGERRLRPLAALAARRCRAGTGAARARKRAARRRLPGRGDRRRRRGPHRPDRPDPHRRPARRRAPVRAAGRGSSCGNRVPVRPAAHRGPGAAGPAARARRGVRTPQLWSAPPAGGADDRPDRSDLSPRWPLVRAGLQVQSPARLRPRRAAAGDGAQRIRPAGADLHPGPASLAGFSPARLRLRA